MWPVVSDDVGERGSEYPTADSGASGAPIVVSNSYQHGAIVEQGTFSQTVGVMAHEFGHSFNLPDLYDLSFEGPADDSAGIGRWGLMGWGAHGWTGSDGPVGFSAWSLERLGWLGVGNSRLLVVRDDLRDVPISDAVAGGPVYKM